MSNKAIHNKVKGDKRAICKSWKYMEATIIRNLTNFLNLKTQFFFIY